MPNSTELRLVIQTLTVNSDHSALAWLLAGFAGLRGSASALSTVTARASTSDFASRAASAAAALASISRDVLLPSAMRAAPGGGAGTRRQVARITRPRLAPRLRLTRGLRECIRQKAVCCVERGRP